MVSWSWRGELESGGARFLRVGGDNIVLAVTLLWTPDLGKIIKITLHGAMPGLCTLPMLNFARCEMKTSHGAKLRHCTLQSCCTAPCDFRMLHLATQKA